MNKRKFSVFVTALFCMLSFVAAAITLYSLSPVHPKNITDETVVQKGEEYTLKLRGISEYDEGGFTLVTDGFYFTGNKAYVYEDENGLARTTYDGKGEAYLLGEYNSDRVDYTGYEFCGEAYKTKAELEAFFDKPDPIYNFDINNFSYYISDVITFEKKFWGTATVKIYRGRCVITEIYIGDEKVLELKK